MNKKIITLGITLAILAMFGASPGFAEVSTSSARIEKLEERTRDLEARLAKVEEATHKQMGMMQQGQDMTNKGMKMGMDNHPMGQMPQQVPQQNPGMGTGMPQGAAPQQQGAGMPMGDM